MMTAALLVLESGADLSAGITIPASLTPELQSIRASRGHTVRPAGRQRRLRRIDMMAHAMLLPSANDAASVLAVDTSGSLAAFAAQMVRPSQPAGLAYGHPFHPVPMASTTACDFSTARDMAKVARRWPAMPEPDLSPDSGHGVL
ncbi:MAG: hypothetical protein ACLVJH_01695 [Faecalibacterium prausnitzii]